MIGESFKKEPWHIPKEMVKAFNTQRLDEVLGMFDRVCDGNFYIEDYLNGSVFVGDASRSTTTGYSRTIVEKEGFNFYRRILKADEYEWYIKMTREASRILYSYPDVQQRKNLEFSYYLMATTINKNDIILRYKLVPYLFDGNGNLWLGLLSSQQLFAQPSGAKATVSNFENGEVYEFKDGEFVLSRTKALTNEEVTILKWIANGISGKNICHLLKVSERSLERKKQSTFSKLSADTPAAAVYKATLLGII
jgi:DNA-binding CsgD family transcriptional regulator